MDQADWKQKYDAFLATKCEMELKCIPIAEITQNLLYTTTSFILYYHAVTLRQISSKSVHGELFSSVVFCPIIRSFPWFSAESVHRESDVLWSLSLTKLLSAEIFSFYSFSEPRGRDRVIQTRSLIGPYLPASDRFISILIWCWIRRYFSGQYLRYFWTDFDAVFCKIGRKVRAIYCAIERTASYSAS